MLRNRCVSLRLPNTTGHVTNTASYGSARLRAVMQQCSFRRKNTKRMGFAGVVVKSWWVSVTSPPTSKRSPWSNVTGAFLWPMHPCTSQVKARPCAPSSRASKANAFLDFCSLFLPRSHHNSALSRHSQVLFMGAPLNWQVTLAG